MKIDKERSQLHSKWLESGDNNSDVNGNNNISGNGSSNCHGNSYDNSNSKHFKTCFFTVAALHVFLANFVAELVWSNQVATVQEDGSVYEVLGLISQLMLASLDTAMLPIQADVSAQIQLQEVSVSQGFSALMGHENQHHAHEVWKI